MNEVYNLYNLASIQTKRVADIKVSDDLFVDDERKEVMTILYPELLGHNVIVIPVHFAINDFIRLFKESKDER